MDTLFASPFGANAIAALLGYLCGSIPFGLIFARVFCNIDPRFHGSNNIGTTNIARLCGKKWGIVTLLFDLGKGALPVFVAGSTLSSFHLAALSMNTTNIAWALPLVAGAFAVLGHMFPVWLLFKGGKGVATTVGVFFALAPAAFLCSGVLFLLTTKITGFVSAGSLVLSATLPIFLYFFGKTPEAVLATLMFFCITYAHRQNIKRLINGTEKSWKPSATAPAPSVKSANQTNSSK